MNNPRVKIVCEFGKLVLARFFFFLLEILSGSCVFFGKCYSCGGIIILYTFENENKNKVNYVYILGSFILWHGRLWHICICAMKRMLKCKLISYDLTKVHKYKTSVESKIIRKQFQV